MKKFLLPLISLIILQGIIDLAYAQIVPQVIVSPLRATLIGFTALVILLAAGLTVRRPIVDPLIGAFSILSSAFFGALLVQADYLISKSIFSTVIHIAILIVTYLILDRATAKRVA